jgi:hypothetical protein
VLGRRSAVESDRVVVAVDALEKDAKRAVGRRAANMVERWRKGICVSISCHLSRHETLTYKAILNLMDLGYLGYAVHH